MPRFAWRNCVAASDNLKTNREKHGTAQQGHEPVEARFLRSGRPVGFINVRFAGYAQCSTDKRRMDTLTSAQAAEWCSARSIPLDDRGRPLKATAADDFDIPEDAGKRIWLVGDQLATFRNEPEVLLWFTEWSVWPSGERPHIFYRLRAAYGQDRPLIEAPAQTFVPGECDDLVSFATLGVLFLWDVFVISGRSRPIVHYSHDEVGWRTL